MTWVVMEAFVGAQKVWAWGLVGAHPGFDEIRLTKADGTTPVDMPPLPDLRLGAHLFTVSVPEMVRGHSAAFEDQMP